MRGHDNKPHKRAWLGILLVVLGSFFLLDNLNLLPGIPYYFFGWEMLFILIGTTLLITGRRGGLIFIAIGGFFLMDEIIGRYLYWWDIRDWWPLILVITGMAILLRRRDAGRQDTPEIDYFDEVSIFGGSKKIISSQNFQGGKLTSIFGGNDVNLLQAKPAPGNNVIDVFTMFGGFNLIVPADWTVKMKASVILGGFEDKRLITGDTQPDPNKVVTVKGLVLLGGGEIKSS